MLVGAVCIAGFPHPPPSRLSPSAGRPLGWAIIWNDRQVSLAYWISSARSRAVKFRTRVVADACAPTLNGTLPTTNVRVTRINLVKSRGCIGRPPDIGRGGVRFDVQFSMGSAGEPVCSV